MTSIGAGDATPEGACTAYWILFLQGLGNLFPWNTFITASHYFNMRFCGASYQTGFENYFSLVTMLSQVCGLTLSIIYLEKYPLKYCVLVPLALSTLVMALSNILVGATSISQDALFAVTLLSCAIFGVNSAVSGGGIFGLSGCLPSAYTGAVMCGQGLGGVVVSVISISTIYYSPVVSFCPTRPHEDNGMNTPIASEGECVVTVDHSAVFFFAACCVVLLLCFGTFFALLVLPFTMFHQERVCLDLMRGISLDDLHAGLAQRGSEALLDRMLVEEYDLDLLKEPQLKTGHQQKSNHLPADLALEVAASREEVDYGSMAGVEDGDDYFVGSRGRGVSIGLSDVDDMEHSHMYRYPLPEGHGTQSLEMTRLLPAPLPPPSPVEVVHHYNTSFTTIFCKIRPAASAIFFILLCTLSIFPSHTVLIESQHKCSAEASRLHNDLFTPCLFLLFYVADFTGRALAGVARMGITADTLWRPVWARFLLLPLMMMCRVKGSHLPLVFESDMWPALFLTLFAVTNGFLSTLAMMFGPAMVSVRKSPIAGSVMILSLNIGLLAGSFLSFLVLFVSTGGQHMASAR